MRESQIEGIVAEVVARLLAERPVGPDSATAAEPEPGGTSSTLLLTERPARVIPRLATLPLAVRRRLALMTSVPLPRDAAATFVAEVICATDRRDMDPGLVSRFDALFLIEVGYPTLARLAHLVATEPLVEVVFHALCELKPVTMEPVSDRDDYRRLPPGLRTEIGLMVERLLSYGIREGTPFGWQAGQRQPAGDMAGQHGSRRAGDIVTLDEIRDLCRSGGDRVELGANVRLTDLAAEYIAKMGIEVFYR